MTVAAFFAIYLVHLAAAMSPGPTTLLAARSAACDGFDRAIFLAIGFGVGACLWAVAAIFGLAILFEHAPAVLLGLKLVGAGYLFYLALRVWRSAALPFEVTPIPTDEAPKSAAKLIWLGIATQLANPKPAVFFGTIFLTFLPANPDHWVYAVVLGMIFVNDAGWNLIVARIFSLSGPRRAYLGFKPVIERIFGGLLTLMGAKLALG
ncbi:LysE family translocator [Paracoccaceae bacterium]|nr:LysE family translocator [Paracoccaceae bacterium]